MTLQHANRDLVSALEDYLLKRRALGFSLIKQELHARNFLHWLWASGNTSAVFTATEVTAWAQGQGDFKSSYQHQRLSAVRGLARYCQGLGLDVQVPGTHTLGVGKDRRRPHIYSQQEVDALITACRDVLIHPLVQTTMTHLIAVLAVTGMRPGEALRLRPADLDADGQTLLIRANKHGPDRLIPLDSTTVEALIGYQDDPYRQAVDPEPDGPLFVTTRGGACQQPTVAHHFRRICDAADFTWEGPTPCLRDLRHSFATRHMIQAYTTEGADPAATLSLLATWLGHSDPSHTYWYIEAVPELLALAAGRADHTTTRKCSIS